MESEVLLKSPRDHLPCSARSFVLERDVEHCLLFQERAAYATQPPNAEGAEKPRNKPDQSHLLVKGVLLGEFTDRSMVLGGWRIGRSLYLSPQTQGFCALGKRCKCSLQDRQSGRCVMAHNLCNHIKADMVTH